VAAAQHVFAAVQSLWSSRGRATEGLVKQLQHDVGDALARSQPVLADADGSARKAVLLLTARDFVDIAVEYSLAVLEEGQDAVLGQVVQALHAQHESLLDGWRALLEEHEASARAALDRKEEQLQLARHSSAELLRAAEQLHKDSADLACQNHRLQLEVSEYWGAQLFARGLASKRNRMTQPIAESVVSAAGPRAAGA